MKKKIVFVSFAVVAFVVVAFVLFQTKEKKNRVENVASSSFSSTQIQEAMNKKADPNMKPIFSQAEINVAANKKVLVKK